MVREMAQLTDKNACCTSTHMKSVPGCLQPQHASKQRQEDYSQPSSKLSERPVSGMRWRAMKEDT